MAATSFVYARGPGKSVLAPPPNAMAGGAVDLSTLEALQQETIDCLKAKGDTEILMGCDAAGTEIERRITTFDDGTSTTTDYINGVPQVTTSPTFTATKPDADQIEGDSEIVYATITDEADPEFGRVVEASREDVRVNGAIDPDRTTFWNKNVIPSIDITALLADAKFQLSAAPIRKQLPPTPLPSHTQTVSGDANLALADVPQFATYAEIYIEAGTGDSGIRWTKDGSAPTNDSAQEQEGSGVTIKLLDRDSIDGFRASAMDLATGDIDAGSTAIIKAVYSNVAPDED